MEGNLRLKIDWGRLIVGRKFTFLLGFTLYLLHLEGLIHGRG